MSFNAGDNWDSILDKLGSPFNWILTKEGYSIINAFITSREFIMLANFYQFLANLSTNPNFFNVLLKYIVIRGVGAILINNKQVNLNALVSALQVQRDMYVALVNVLNTLTNTISAVAFNPVANAKWASILTAVLTALAATGTAIGQLKNDIRAVINQDIFCLTPCTVFSPLELNTKDNVEDTRDKFDNIIKELKELEATLINQNKGKKNASQPTTTTSTNSLVSTQ